MLRRCGKHPEAWPIPELEVPAMSTIASPVKSCSHCRTDLPLTSFARRSGTPDMLSYVCRDCTNAYYRARRAMRPRKPSPWDERVVRPDQRCSLCKVWKPKSDFHAAASSRTGRGSRCKDCVRLWSPVKNERARQRRKDRPEIEQQQRERRKERRRNQPRQYKPRTENQRINGRRWAEKNADLVRERAREWARRHKDRSQVQKAKRRARMRNAQGSFTAKEWNELCGFYGHRCLACGGSGTLSVDHVMPISLGGSNDIGNIQPLCLRCNLRKGAKHIDYRTECIPSVEQLMLF